MEEMPLTVPDPPGPERPTGGGVPQGGRRRGQAGFSYLEILIGITILAIVAGAVVQGFSAAGAQVGRSRLDSVATDIAQSTLERVRAMDYDDVGIAGGNPPGTLTASRTRRVDNTDYLVQLAVSYADDPTPGRPRTYINYKRVVVTVTPQVPNARAITQSTISAPPNYGAVSGKATAVITVVDSLTDQPIQGVSVRLDGSTSAARVDTTGADGKVIFAGLDPSDPDPTSSTYRYRATATLAGFSTHPDSVSVQQSLTAAQTWQATIKMYRPASVRVNVRDRATGQFVTERTEVRYTTPPPASISQAFVGYTGQFLIDRVNGNELQPSNTASTVVAIPDCYRSASGSSPVPVGYPTNTVQTFDLDVDRLAATGYVDVWVVDNANGKPIPGATASATGGPMATLDLPTQRTVDGNGYTRFCLTQSGSVPYLISAGAPGYGAGSLPASVAQNRTTPVTLRLVKGTVGNIRLLASSSGVLVRLQGLAGTYDLSQPTNAFGYADFVGLTAGSYMAYVATGFSGGSPVWSLGTPVTAVAGQTTSYRP